MPKFLVLRPVTDEESQEIHRLAHARTAPARTVERAQIVWRAHQGERVPTPADAHDHASGGSISVELPQLIKRVVVNPMANSDFIRTVRKSAENADLLARVVETSAIARTASRL